jgi:hypothetical protein
MTFITAVRVRNGLYGLLSSLAGRRGREERIPGFFGHYNFPDHLQLLVILNLCNIVRNSVDVEVLVADRLEVVRAQTTALRLLEPLGACADGLSFMLLLLAQQINDIGENLAVFLRIVKLHNAL